MHCQSRFLFTGVGLYPALSNRDWNIKGEQQPKQDEFIDMWVLGERSVVIFKFFSIEIVVGGQTSEAVVGRALCVWMRGHMLS